MWRCWPLPSPCYLTFAPGVSVYVESGKGVKGTDRSPHMGENTTKDQGDEFTDGWWSYLDVRNTELFFFFGWKELPSSKIHYLRGLWSDRLFTDEILKLASSTPKMCPADPLLILFPPKSVGQDIRVSASASVLPMNIQGWFPLGLTGLISLQSKGLSRVFSSTTVQKHQFFGSQSSLQSNSHIHTRLLEKQ